MPTVQPRVHRHAARNTHSFQGYGWSDSSHCSMKPWCLVCIGPAASTGRDCHDRRQCMHLQFNTARRGNQVVANTHLDAAGEVGELAEVSVLQWPRAGQLRGRHQLQTLQLCQHLSLHLRVLWDQVPVFPAPHSEPPQTTREMKIKLSQWILCARNFWRLGQMQAHLGVMPAAAHLHAKSQGSFSSGQSQHWQGEIAKTTADIS